MADTKDLKHIMEVQNKAILLYDHETLMQVIDRLSSEITEKLGNTDPILLCTLNGAVMFFGHLLARLKFPLETDYIHVTRYGDKTIGSHSEWISKPHIKLQDRTILVVEDILDEGITLKEIIEFCYANGAKKVYTVALTEKGCKKSDKGLQSADFTGLKVPNKFLIGFGLDYQGHCRNMDGIYCVEE